VTLSILKLYGGKLGENLTFIDNCKHGDVVPRKSSYRFCIKCVLCNYHIKNLLTLWSLRVFSVETFEVFTVL
jgi:hypothetical protein